MYKFVKIKDIKCGIEYPYMLYCDSLETLFEHNKTYMSTIITDAYINLVEVNKGRAHCNTKFGLLTKLQDGKNLIDQMSNAEFKINEAKIKCLFNKGNILLRSNGSFMYLDQDHKIIQEIEKENIAYPKWTKEDIVITKWPDGSHYYANIGNLSVVVDGEQKWNAKWLAQRKAEEYLKTLN